MSSPYKLAHYLTRRLNAVMQSQNCFDTTEGLPIDSRRVRRLFAAPGKVAESGFLRREIADRMHERLSVVKIAPQRVLDAGCGEGADLPELRKRFPDAQVLGADASPGMLAEASVRYNAAPQRSGGLFGKWRKKAGAGFSLVCCDFARLPLAGGAIDVLWSNLALHWHSRADQVFAEWLRVLRTDGVLMFSCFGPDTLQELRAAFAEIDNYPHVLPFTEMHDLGDMLVAAGFSSPVLDREVITVTYGSVDKLLADVRAFGGNALANRRHGLFGRQARKRIDQFFEERKNSDGRFSLSFEIIYGHAFRPAPAMTSNGEKIVHFLPRG